MSATHSRLIRGLKSLDDNDAERAERILREVSRDPDDLDVPVAGLDPMTEACFHELRAALALESDDLERADAALAQAQDLRESTPALAPTGLISASAFERDAGYLERLVSTDDDGVRRTSTAQGCHHRRAASALVREDDHTLTLEEHDASITTESYSYTEETPDGRLVEVHCERQVEHIERLRQTTIFHDQVLPPAPETHVMTVIEHHETTDDDEHTAHTHVSSFEVPAQPAALTAEAEDHEVEDRDDEDDDEDDWDDEDGDEDWDDEDDADWDDDEDWDDDDNEDLDDEDLDDDD